MIRELLARTLGPRYIEHRTQEGWSGSLPFYLVHCPLHGYYEDYPHGHREYFTCPECYEVQGLRADTPIGNEVGRAGEGKPTDEPIDPGSEVRPLKQSMREGKE